MEWLQSLFSGENQALTLVLTFFAIAALLIASIWLFRKIAGGGALKPNRNRQPRLSVTDAAIVDEKRRLVLVRRDNVEHLVMIGGPSDIVIEQNIVRTQPATLPQAREAAPVREPAMSEPPAPRRIEREPIAEREPFIPDDSRERAAAMSAAQYSPASRRAEERESLPELQPVAEPARRPAAAATVAAASVAIPVAAATAMPAAAEEPELAPFAPQDYADDDLLPELMDEPFAEPSPEPVLADLEIDFEGELERSLEDHPASTVSRPASLESDLTAELSDDLDFARLLGEQENVQAVPPITTPEPAQRRQEKVDDEMQRLLDELANA